MKYKRILSGDNWEVARCPGDVIVNDWKDTIMGSVPGNIVEDLQKAGLVQEPFYGENFRGLSWIENWTFWYRSSFTLSLPETERINKRCYFLNFEGIDTFAEIYLNGKLVGKTHNMFRRYEFDVTSIIKNYSSNELVVRFPPINSATERWIDMLQIDPETLAPHAYGYRKRALVRKAQMSYGWDQTPRILAGGIHRDVFLTIYDGPCLGDWTWNVHELNTEQKRAKIDFNGEVKGTGGCIIRVNGYCDGSVFEGLAAIKNKKWSICCVVDDARLWWPNGIGKQDLYRINFQLVDEEGNILDTYNSQIGLRTFQVLTEPHFKQMVDYRIGRPEKHALMDVGADVGAWRRIKLDTPEEVEVSPFNMVVNGRKVFMKGYDWQNPEVFFGCETEEKIGKLLSYCLDSNANILRVWGGATVEIDRFYELCSEMGIMVWQDFYFASSAYPIDNKMFLEEVADEAEDMVKRLRNHTCLALWCGDNESDMINYDRGVNPANNSINKGILPEALSVYDPQKRYYHPSSPSGGNYPRSDWGGDKRNWGACTPDGNYYHIRQENARIISEGGYYVLPSIKSIQRFMPESRMWTLENATWLLHCGHLDIGLQKKGFAYGLMKCIQYFNSSCNNIKNAVEISQFAHAWGIKLLAERMRQRMFDSGGVFLWKLTASWPCADGMVVDYYLHPLLSFEYMREAYKTVAVSLTQSFDDNMADVNVYICNDHMYNIEGKLRIAAVEVDFNAENNNLLLKTCIFKEYKINAAANCSLLADKIFIQGLNRQSVVFGAEFIWLEAEESSMGLFSLEPRTIFKALKSVEYKQRALCEKLLSNVLTENYF